MPCIGWCRLVWLKKNVEVFSQWQVHRMVSFALLLLRDFLHRKLSLLREKEWSAAAHNGHLRQQQSYCILLKHEKYIQLEACEADFTVLYKKHSTRPSAVNKVTVSHGKVAGCGPRDAAQRSGAVSANALARPMGGSKGNPESRSRHQQHSTTKYVTLMCRIYVKL